MINQVNGQNPQSLALQGVNRAQEQFAEAAVDVTNAFAGAANEIQSQRAGGTGVNASAQVAAQEAGQSDPATAMVKMKEAESMMKANIKVLEIQDQMQDDLQGMMKKRLDV